MIGQTEEDHCKTEGQSHHGKQSFLRDSNTVPGQSPPVQLPTGLSICCYKTFFKGSIGPYHCSLSLFVFFYEGHVTVSLKYIYGQNNGTFKRS